MSFFANTPEPPYYAVITSSVKEDEDTEYTRMFDEMNALAQNAQGYLGMENVRGEDGFGITVSFWNSMDAIRDWKMNARHQIAQDKAKEKWYASYKTRICKVERDDQFQRPHA